MDPHYLNETGGVCIYCGHKLDGDATIDHIVPRSEGGPNEDFNKVACCAACNSAKGRLPLPIFARRMSISKRRHYLNRVRELYRQGKIDEDKMRLLLALEPYRSWGKMFHLWERQVKVLVIFR